jgi:hypothetical protein
LKGGRTTLETVKEACADTLAGAKIAATLARGLARPFFSVDRKKAKLVEAAKADPAGALKLTAAALKAVKAESAMNLDYHMLARQRAEIYLALGKKADAKKEIRSMRGDLAKRGVNAPVLVAIESYEKSLA